MLHEHIHDAFDALEDRDGQSRLTPQDDQFEVLVSIIADETSLSPDELRISEQKFKDEVKVILEDISDSDDPISNFHSRLHKLKADVEDRYQEYTILFPWNFREKDAEGFTHPVEILGVEFRLTAKQVWDDYVERASEESTFDKFLEEVPTKHHHESPFSHHRYWEAEVEAADPQYAVNRVETALKTLMGKITYSAYFASTPNTFRSTTWKYGITELQTPVCYIALEDSEYLHYYVSYDYRPRQTFKFRAGLGCNFEELYNDLPDFHGELTTIEEHLGTALRAFQSGMSKARPTQSFLEFWRALEAATLSQEEDYSAAAPLERSTAALLPEDRDLAEERIKLLADKRNDLIHGGKEVEVTEGDRVYLKNLCEASIRFVANERENHSFEELQFLFEYGAKSDDKILQAQTERERQITEKRGEIEGHEHDLKLLEKLEEMRENAESQE